MEPICHYAVAIDTEEQWDWSQPPPVTASDVSHVHERLPALIHLLSQRRVHITCFANYAVMANEAAAGALLGLKHTYDASLELAMHLHPWNTPPHDPSLPQDEPHTYLSNLPTHLVRAKLGTTLACFTRRGLRPICFRGGRYDSGPAVRQWLSAFGFLADCSIVPYTRWAHLCGSPDYRERDLYPRRTPEGLWEIPLTRGFSARPFARWARFFARHERGFWPRVLKHLGVCEQIWLNLEFTPVNEMRKLLPVLLAEGVRGINFTMHSNTLVPGCTPYARSERQVRRLLDRVRRFFDELACDDRFEPRTLGEMARQLELNHQQDTARRTSHARHWDLAA